MMFSSKNKDCYLHPVEIAEDVFWVGSFLPEDRFQCHVYLIREKDESVLIDPGSVLTYRSVVNKVKELIDPREIKYLICHHQDPDITACISFLEKEFPRDDRLVVTHWRTAALLKHYGWRSPFWLVDENDWCLQLKSGRTLKFIFTPYAHFPGAFCSYDEFTGVLFSSDLFGGFSDREELFAEDESCFEGIKLFHEHYIPSKEILENALSEISRYNVRIIAPQHGYIIPPRLVPYLFAKLRTIECGLFFLSRYTQNLALLSRINRILKDFLEVVTREVRLGIVLQHFHYLLSDLLPIKSFGVLTEYLGEILYYSSVLRVSPRRFFREADLFEFYFRKTKEMHNRVYDISIVENLPFEQGPTPAIIFGLRSTEKNLPLGLGILILREENLPKELLVIFERCAHVLSVALERELKFLELEQEREKLYALAVQDQLTGLFNRFYLRIIGEPLLQNAKRHYFPVTVMIVDLDHFKKINDTYGHLVGDKVLREVGIVIQKCIRNGDIPIRYGGEEFLILLPYASKKEAYKVAERLRQQIQNLSIATDCGALRITVSIGIAEFDGQEKLEDLIKRADDALYRAKRCGRDQIVCN